MSILHTETLHLGPEATPTEWATPATPTPADDAAAAARWRRAPWVPWGTHEPYANLYPRKLEELYLRSGYFRRIADDKAEQVRGEGLLLEGPRAPEAQAWLHELGLTDDALEALAFDLSLFNGCALQVVWQRGGQRPAQVQPQRLAQVRVARPTPGQPHHPGYYLSANWAALNAQGRLRFRHTPDALPVYVPAYSPAQAHQGRQLLLAAKYSPVAQHYPLPEAESVYEELALAADVVAFQRRYVQNGMVASAIAYVPFVPEESLPGGSLSPHDQQRMEARRQQLAQELTGNLRAGQVSIIWFNPHLTDRNGNPVGVPRIERPVEERNDQKFIEVQRESRQSFLTGLGVVSGEVFGIPSAGGFSSQADLLTVANDLSYQKTIRPKQDILLRVVRTLLAAGGYPGVQPSIANPLPVVHRITPQMVQMGIFTPNEFREAYGYPPLPPAS